MIQGTKKEINSIVSKPKESLYSCLQTKGQEVFSISSSNLNYPSKKPCVLGCSHRPNFHPKHPTAIQQNLEIHQDSSCEVVKKTKAINEHSEGKSQICLNEQKAVEPYPKHFDDIYPRKTANKNEYIISPGKLEKCSCDKNCDNNEKFLNYNLKLSNISNNYLSSSPLDLEKCKKYSCSCHKNNASLNLIEPSKRFQLCKNVLIQQENNIRRSKCSCDMFLLLNNLKSALKYFFKKKLLLLCFVAILFFLLGLGIQFYGTNKYLNGALTRSDYASLIGMKPHYVKKKSLQRNLKEIDSKDILDSLFISVKTTQKYHYPRVIVQLETWASLVKEQVTFFTTFSDLNQIFL